MKLVTVMAAAALAGSALLGSAADFYDISQDGDEAFMNAVEGFFLLGSETLEPSTIGQNEEVALDGPILAPGIANGPFPEGTQTALGITLQVNTLGAAPATLSAGGTLFALGPGVDGAGFIRVGPENAAHGLDILLEPPGFLGEVIGLQFSLFATTPTAEVRVFNPNNDLLGSATISGLGNASKEIGLFVPAEEVMFRVNLWSDGGWAEAGNFRLYVVPEPATWALLLIGMAGMGLLRFWRRRAIR